MVVVAHGSDVCASRLVRSPQRIRPVARSRYRYRTRLTMPVVQNTIPGHTTHHPTLLLFVPTSGGHTCTTGSARSRPDLDRHVATSRRGRGRTAAAGGIRPRAKGKDPHGRDDEDGFRAPDW